MANQNTPSTEVLLTLLSDKDDVIASLAMEQIFKTDATDYFLAECEDTDDQMLRRRIQQMSVIQQRRGLKESLLRKIKLGILTLWEGVLCIDLLYDHQSSRSYLQRMYTDLEHCLPASAKTLHDVNKFMVDQNFRLHTEPTMSMTNYLVGDALEVKEGSPLIMSIIIWKLCQDHEIPCNFCIFSGHISITDGDGYVISSGNAMNSYDEVPKNKYDICTDEAKILKVVLAQMLQCAIASGDSWDVYFAFDLISRIDAINRDKLQFPLGNRNIP